MGGDVPAGVAEPQGSPQRTLGGGAGRFAIVHLRRGYFPDIRSGSLQEHDETTVETTPGARRGGGGGRGARGRVIG